MYKQVEKDAKTTHLRLLSLWGGVKKVFIEWRSLE
tara:strand:+ start:167 stop:271 length:105 start_codon:yes stop_codon:yes gene_type:complete